MTSVAFDIIHEHSGPARRRYGDLKPSNIVFVKELSGVIKEIVVAQTHRDAARLFAEETPEALLANGNLTFPTTRISWFVLALCTALHVFWVAKQMPIEASILEASQFALPVALAFHQICTVFKRISIRCILCVLPFELTEAEARDKALRVTFAIFY